jgi:tRNA-dihydrouridine synthase B
MTRGLDAAVTGNGTGLYAAETERDAKDASLDAENPFLLAPLAGITDMPFRKLCHEQGAALVFSEMVSAKALHYRDEKSFALLATDAGKGSGMGLYEAETGREAKDAGLREAETGLGDAEAGSSAAPDDGEGPVAFQFFGSEPEIMAEAVRLTADYPNVAIDVNMGCPVPKIV